MNPLKALISYLRSVQSELHKVSWPSRRDTFRYSGLVIGISVAGAALFAALDLGFTKLVEAGITERSKILSQQQAPAQNNTAPTPAQTTSGQPTIDFKDVTPITTPGASSSTTK